MGSTAKLLKSNLKGIHQYPIHDMPRNEETKVAFGGLLPDLHGSHKGATRPWLIFDTSYLIPFS